MLIHQSLGYLLNTSARSMKSRLNDEVKRAGITTAQWAVLKILSEKEPLTQVDIAANLKSDKATVGAILKKLERKAFVRKERSLLDKRAQILFLTNDGKRLITELVESAETVNHQALKGFNQQQRKDLAHYLEQIISNLEDKEAGKNELDQ